MRFRIDGRIYEAAALDQLMLKDILLFERDAAALGRPMKWGQIEAWAKELDVYYETIANPRSTKAAKDEAERAAKDHEGAMWVIAMTIWASRRVAGETLTFEQATEFPMHQLEWLPDPQDRKVAANPTKARPATRKASGRAASKRPAAKARARS